MKKGGKKLKQRTVAPLTAPTAETEESMDIGIANIFVLPRRTSCDGIRSGSVLSEKTDISVCVCVISSERKGEVLAFYREA